MSLSVRLDGCISQDDVFDLRRLVVRGVVLVATDIVQTVAVHVPVAGLEKTTSQRSKEYTNTTVTQWNPSQVFVSGLSDALFGSTYRNLRLVFDGNGATPSVVIRGVSSDDSPDGYAVLGIGEKQRNGSLFAPWYEGRLLVGRLEVGDGISAKADCPTEAFGLPDLNIRISACHTRGVGGGGTLRTTVDSIEVTDSSSQAPAGVRGAPRQFSAKEARARINYAWAHHNCGFSWHIRLKNAEYAFTKESPDCGGFVPEAPDCGSTHCCKYRVRYNGSDPWNEMEVPAGTLAQCP